MSGISPFSYVHEEDEDLLCDRCDQTWAKPVELKPCGHIQCRGCTQGTTHCFTCQQEFTETVLPHPLLLKAANKVIVQCEDCGLQMSRLDSYAHHCAPPVARACGGLVRPHPAKPVSSPKFDPPARMPLQMQPFVHRAPPLLDPPPRPREPEQPHCAAAEDPPLDPPQRSPSFARAPVAPLHQVHRYGRAAAPGLPSAPAPTLSSASPDDVLALTEREGPGSYPQDSLTKGKAKAIELVFSAVTARAAIEAAVIAEREAMAAAAAANRATIEAAAPFAWWPRDVCQKPRHMRINRCDTAIMNELLQLSDVHPSTAFDTKGWHVYVVEGMPYRLPRVLLLDLLQHLGLCADMSALCCVWGDELTMSGHGTWLLAFRWPLTALQLDPTAAGPVSSGERPFTFERENSRTLWQLQPTGLQITPR